MTDSGYNIQHSSVIHGLGVIEERLKIDADYVAIVKEFEKAVFI